MFISVLRAFFNQMWQTGTEADRRIDELKTGIPIGETTVIKDPNDAWLKVEQTLKAAQKDVVLITSSQSLLSFMENDPFAKFHKNGVSFRLMAPIDLDNLDAAKKLASKYEIRHVPINYMTMMLVDDYNLFMFKSPPISDMTDEAFYLTDAFYTNDPKSSEKVSEMLNDTWKRGTDLSEITSQAGMKLPSITVSINDTINKLVEIVMRNNVTQVLITNNTNKPVGLINDRDILKEVVEGMKDPETTLTGELDYTPLLTLGSRETMTDALRIMREKGVKRIAVVKNGQLMGMLTQQVSLKESEPMKVAAKK